MGLFKERDCVGDDGSADSLLQHIIARRRRLAIMFEDDVRRPYMACVLGYVPSLSTLCI